MVIIGVACTEIPLEVPVSKVEADVIENPDYEVIRSMGFQTEGIIEQEDHYVIEGDILLSKSYVDSLGLSPKTRQARREMLITGGKENGIVVVISSKYIPDAAWREAARQAVDIWYAIPNCSVLFYKTETDVLPYDVMVKMDNAPSVADASFPKLGKPGSIVRINPTIDWYNDTHEEKVYILVHEFGHILGLSHTDYVASYERDPEDHDYDNPNQKLSHYRNSFDRECKCYA